MKAKIYYIYHSGFVVKTTNYLLVFDYYKDPNFLIDNLLKDPILSKENIGNNFLVFSSHGHEDHFNPYVFKWKDVNSNIKYILSNDIKVTEHNLNYYLIDEDDEIIDSGIYIKAYGSTDIGVSFLVTVDDITIFHAGDLNWWHWKEDSKEDQLLAENSFKTIIEKMKKHKDKIDIAFFPVDPRLGEFYHIGGEYFAKALNPKLIIPMHFGNYFYITKEFKKIMDKISVNSSIINSIGEQIDY